MPMIIPSSDLRNKYNDISKICHESNNPVYITKNGAGDLAIMSIEAYEKITDKILLMEELDKGMKYAKKGNLIPKDKIIKKLEERLKNGEI